MKMKMKPSKLASVDKASAKPPKMPNEGWDGARGGKAKMTVKSAAKKMARKK